MKVYAVLLDEVEADNSEVEKLIHENYPDNYKFNNSVYFISSQDDTSLEIARVIGIRGKDRIKTSGGVVFRLSQRYAGFAHGDLWEWLDDAFEKTK